MYLPTFHTWRGWNNYMWVWYSQNKTLILFTLWKIWHGLSWKFHVISRHKSTAVYSKSTPNSMKIPCHLSTFYLFSFCHTKTWHGFWTKSSHGISMAFSNKMMGFPLDFASFSIRLPSKRHDKIYVTFFKAYTNFSCFSVTNCLPFSIIKTNESDSDVLWSRTTFEHNL